MPELLRQMLQCQHAIPLDELVSVSHDTLHDFFEKQGQPLTDKIIDLVGVTHKIDPSAAIEEKKRREEKEEKGERRGIGVVLFSCYLFVDLCYLMCYVVIYCWLFVLFFFFIEVIALSLVFHIFHFQASLQISSLTLLIVDIDAWDLLSLLHNTHENLNFVKLIIFSLKKKKIFDYL